MGRENYKDLLDSIQEEKEVPILKLHDRVLIIDGLNLFFRNFAALNMINPDGIHVGGLGGFLRSLGALIKNIVPTSVYIIFDGEASSQSRKNILPEYKLGRGVQRITNWDVFDNLKEEEDSKINQLVRVIQYLKLLPVKIMVINKIEADDIIAVLSNYFPKKYNSTVFIVSTDKDFLQLVNKNVIVYRPMEKVFYTPNMVFEKFGILTENFIIYKTLLGDASDKLQGVKGLGIKKLFKFFPLIKTKKLTLEDIFTLSEANYKTHLIFARILQDRNRLENTYKIMDLRYPMVNVKQIKYLKNIIKEDVPLLQKEEFLKLYEDDKLGGIVRNLEMWMRDYFAPLNTY